MTTPTRQTRHSETCFGHTEYTYTLSDLTLLKQCLDCNTRLSAALIDFRAVKNCSYHDLMDFWLDFAVKLREGKTVNDLFHPAKPPF